MKEGTGFAVSETVVQEKHERSTVITTTSGNKISRAAFLCGPQNIRLHGQTLVKAKATIRGDRAPISVGRFCIFGSRSVIKPSAAFVPTAAAGTAESAASFAPLAIGDFVVVGDGCVVEARKIGSFVLIGEGTVVGNGCIIKDCCRILPGSALPEGMVVPPFSLVSGVPAKIEHKELPCDTAQIIEESCMQEFKRFVVT